MRPRDLPVVLDGSVAAWTKSASSGDAIARRMAPELAPIPSGWGADPESTPTFAKSYPLPF
jgi:hypothetical protein